MTAKGKILVIDDEMDSLFMLNMHLRNCGYDVVTAESGEEGLRKVESEKPDIVLLDLNMPGMDGHEVCDRIKEDARYQFLPVIILTSSDDLSDKLRRLQGGADDYITKYTDLKELEARVQVVLKRYRQNLDSNPLTRLPGNNVITEIITQRLSENKPLAVAYADLDNFKAFNDKYGFKRGDEIILLTANILQVAVKEAGNRTDFVGHVGGDDFIVLSTPDRISPICQFIIEQLDRHIPQYYDKADRQRGFILMRDRQGVLRRFPFVSISIAVVTNEHRSFGTIGEIAKVASELKKFVKSKEGSQFVVDKRSA